MFFIEVLKAILFGIVEGITEWLPVSSTGHIILLDSIIPLDVSDGFFEMFEVVIQLGAILAVVVLFWGKLNPFSRKKNADEKKATWIMWVKICVASIPSAIVGLVLDKMIEHFTGKDIDGWLYNWIVVSIALVVYGIAFIIIERYGKRQAKICSVSEIGYLDAFKIGIFQMMAIVPGTSRSGSTVIGSLLLGLDRVSAAEFSFFMAIPAMFGASLLKVVGFVADGESINIEGGVILAVATIVAFAVSMIAIKYLMNFVKKHTFVPFGIYRIGLAAVVVLYFLIRK